jgi:hypothetical protein
MKLASYTVDGAEAYGVVKGDGVVTMSGRFGKTLREALAADLLPKIKDAAANASPDRKLSEIKFLPVIPDPERIACAGINYRSQCERNRPRDPETAVDVPAAHRHAGGP